jgi:polar amino acid transport system substrate-binding protein
MKKIFTLLMIFALVLMTGCGGSQDNDGKKNSDAGQINLGMIKHLNVTETLLDNYFEKASARMNQTSGMYAPKHIFFDNMTSMLAALQSGQIDAFSTYYSVSNYLIAQNANFETVKDRVPKVSEAFCCAMRGEDTALKKEFDDAILKLTADGKLKQLVQTYITDADYNALPAVDMPHFDNAPTVKVAVTGDLPPLDFVTADGKAAGFNTAMLAAVSQLIGKNFELVQVDSGARAIALTSKEVDVIFWVAVPLNDTLTPPNCDIPDGVIMTEPYFTDEIVHVALKK